MHGGIRQARLDPSPGLVIWRPRYPDAEVRRYLRRKQGFRQLPLRIVAQAFGCHS
jgi:hypothetical protein